MTINRGIVHCRTDITAINKMTDSKNSATDKANDKPTILAVDDSRVMRRAISKILSIQYNVIEAEHGEDAWALLEHHTNIQVVFTDLTMPYLDGYGLLERIRSSEDNRIASLPVIIITGKEDDDQAKMEALEKGADDFIAKPFDKAQLFARAQSHIKFEETSKKLTETAEKLEKQAAVDELTGLGSQRYFEKAADEQLSSLIRHKGSCCLLRIDIDNFNQLFIKHGKDIADEIVQTIGHCLNQHVRKEDMAARVGLAKFALFLNHTDLRQAKALAQRIIDEIPTRKLTTENFTFTASAGIYEPNITADSTFKEIYQLAENNLQEAIDKGGNILVSESHLPIIELDSIDPLTIAQAIKLLEQGESDEVKPHLEHLYDELKPLLILFTQLLKK